MIESSGRRLAKAQASRSTTSRVSRATSARIVSTARRTCAACSGDSLGPGRCPVTPTRRNALGRGTGDSSVLAMRIAC